MSLQLTFQIKIESDYHVGAGHGLGTEIDSALLRDADGVPVLRGTILNGLLRDGLWRLLQQESMQRWQQCEESGKREVEQRYCGQYDTDQTPNSCPICRLFGTPRAIKRWRIGSARPVDHEKPTGTPYQPEDMVRQRVTRVRVNPRTRRAAPRKLFSQEHGGQLTFTFTATCSTADEATLDEAALLMAAARFVRQLGRSRRRGQGECIISLIAVEGANLADDPQEELLRRFDEHWLRGEPQTSVKPNQRPLSRARNEPTAGDPVRLRILARADEPLLIAERASAGNQFKSQPSVTGKTLRGALAAHTADCFDLEHPATCDAFISLFLRGGVRFPTLYPLFPGGRGHFYPAALVPQDGFACKTYRKHPIQWGTQQPEQMETCKECNGPVKGIRQEFLSLRKLDPKRFRPEMRSEMHIQIDPRKGRVEEGQLFEYVALEAGQYFAGELVCADQDAWELLQEFTGLEEKKPIPLWLGKGTRRGYGRVTMWLERLEENKPPVWIQQSLDQRVRDVGELTMTLLTDAVVTDAWGRFVAGFEDGWVSRELDLQVEVVKGHDFAATKVVDGFNTKLRLPRWRDVTLAAGSSVRLRVVGQSETENLLAAIGEIELNGIGLRRNEGYGQVAFNHPLYENCAGLTGTSVQIPDDLDMVLQVEMELATFRREWAEVLDAVKEKRWKQCQDDPFLALARWLDARRSKEIPELLKDIDKLGTPDDQLVERIGGKEEYGEWDKSNRLAGTDGFTLIKSLLVQLQECDRACWSLGVQMLADRLADVAGQKEEGR